MRRNLNILILFEWRRYTQSYAYQAYTSTPRKTPVHLNRGSKPSKELSRPSLAPFTTNSMMFHLNSSGLSIERSVLVRHCSLTSFLFAARFVKENKHIDMCFSRWSRDMQVDDSLSELDRHVPSLVKQASCQARAMASEVQRAGVVDTAKTVTRSVYSKYEPTAKELFNKYEPVVEQYAVSAWRLLNRLPVFPQVAKVMVPTAAYWSDKYNQAVYYYSGEKRYAVASYFPMIPIDRIAKAFEESRRAATILSKGGSLTQ